MPLHLLGKKSWNVYNTDNIAKVRRDEAAAQAKEREEERRRQEVDADRRLAILRGEVPPPIADAPSAEPIEQTESRSHRERIPRKRKRYGEDDTDFELRIAKQASSVHSKQLEASHKPTSSAPITDHAGHIDLFGEDRLRGAFEKNDEAERDKAKKKKEFEDQYTMRFSNAAGKNSLQKPWYSREGEGDSQEIMKDAFGNDDPSRRDRDTRRIVSDDPLALMKRASSQVKRLKAERQRFQDERDEELRQLRKEQTRRERRRSHYDGDRAGRSSMVRSPRRKSDHGSRRHADEKEKRREHSRQEHTRTHRRSASPDRRRRGPD